MLDGERQKLQSVMDPKSPSQIFAYDYSCQKPPVLTKKRPSKFNY